MVTYENKGTDASSVYFRRVICVKCYGVTQVDIPWKRKLI